MESLENPQIIPYLEKNMNHCIFDCKWIPCSPKLVVLGNQPDGSGSLDIIQVSDGVKELETVKTVNTDKGLKCCSFGASNLINRQLATGDFAGQLNIWNLDTLSTIYTAKGHTEIINSIDAIGGSAMNCGAPEIVTGSRDGTVKVWDPRQKEKPVTSMEPFDTETRRDCWAVGFGNSYNNTERIVCAGYDNGDLKMFDLRNMSLRWECNLKNGVIIQIPNHIAVRRKKDVCNLEFDRKDIPMNKLVVTTLEGKFHVFDTRTQHPKKGFAQVVEKEDRNGTVWICRHLPQNRDLFFTCAGSGHLNLWKYEYPDKRFKNDINGGTCGVAGTLKKLQSMLISSQGINSLDFSPDKLGLGICTSFDQILRLFVTTKLNLY